MQSHPTPHLPVNHVFVDLENVKTVDASVVLGRNLTFHLFFGPHNKKLDVVVVEALLENAQAVKLIRSPKPGKNALDFVLAYHLGQAVQGDPKGYYHIVSKDTGFDSLVELLKSKQVKVKRHDDWSELNFNSPPKPAPEAKAPEVKELSKEADKLWGDLKKNATRPKSEKGLLGRAKTIMGKDSSEEWNKQVVQELVKANRISIGEKGAVTYRV